MHAYTMSNLETTEPFNSQFLAYTISGGGVLMM